MRIALLSATAAYLFLASPCHGAEAIAWGPSANGLQMGISFIGISSERGLQISLKNTSSEEKNVFIGSDAGKGLVTDFEFIATDSGGRTFRCAELNSFGAVAGLILPYILRMSPDSAPRDWSYPLRSIICINCDSKKALADFVKVGASIHVLFETDDKKARGAVSSLKIWTGKISSGELKP